MGDVLKLVPRPIDVNERKAQRIVLRTLKAVKVEAKKHGAIAIGICLTYPNGQTYTNVAGITDPAFIGAVSRLYFRVMQED